MTDGVLLDEQNRVRAKTKVPNSADIVTGIKQAIRQVMTSGEATPEDVRVAMLGTTQVTNAIIERKHLTPVLTIRIGAPATVGIPSLASWPEDLAAFGRTHSHIVRGGHEFDGRPITALDEREIARVAHDADGKVGAVAITGVFSPVSDAHERRAEEIVRQEMGPDIPISLSNAIGSISLLERENATILNAMVAALARHICEMFQQAVEASGIHASLYLAQNDGTLMNLAYAQEYPILTVACGPTNSMRGAAFLTGQEDAVVVDIGGTSTDVGILTHGFPRESAVAVELGGVRTNFRMPDLVSVGLGGGSVVRGQSGSQITVGPDSVGYEIVRLGQAFGGETATLTDAALLLGRRPDRQNTPFPGDVGRVRLEPDTANAAYAQAMDRVVDAIARIKTSAHPLPLIAVGGGSFVLPDRLPEVSEVLRPQHYEVANAVGAAMAQISGRVDRIFTMDGRRREEVLAEAEALARKHALDAGAAEDTLERIDLEELPLSYLPGNAVRVKVTVAGSLSSLTIAR
jgi:N-methylhydantoinase A/oxoprolinase/acetone carboxylase beta subunit